ncbi:74f12a19-58e1-42ed-8e83-40abb3de567b [Thermothielavioides terrestris]|uniref:74f12a19-58e1-42ed-8e83-40abb3de567b n=1 Tax=Thermothielavioides terrestris TaxID=2587410 RepID=A0A3S5CXW6_9PEZI|nr:74f12a19-58e1-42ed-8e83-40abb3de567b [Thermothielavioides terrestris]
MGCAADACYSTAPVTTTVLQTVTTTSGTHTLTTTQTAVTVATPSPPTGLPTDNTNAAAKFIPTTVPKVPASSPTSESSGGLSGGAIGGLIAGVVILLIVVVVAAFLIIRRLKRAEAAWASKQGSSSGKKTKSQSQAQMEHYGRQLHSDMDDMSVDPLMVHPNANTNASGTPQPGFDATRGRSDSTGFSASPNAFPPYMDDRSRHASPDSNAGHFDLPARVHNIPGGASAYPQHQSPMQPARIRSNTADSANTYHGYAYHHWRQQSNASELSADGSDHGGAHASVLTPLVPAAAAGATGTISELEASKGYFAELPGTHHRSNSDDFTPGGRGYGHARRPSDGFRQPQQSMPPPGQTSPTVGLSGLGLSTLDETAEMRGYSDGAGQQAGQTAAGFTAAQAGWAAAAQGQAQGQTQRPGPPGPGPGTGTGA